MILKAKKNSCVYTKKALTFEVKKTVGYIIKNQYFKE